MASPVELTEKERTSPSPAVRFRVLAAESIAKGNHAAAAAILADGVTQLPTDVRLAISLARVREASEDWTGAVAAYDAVVRLRPAESRWRLRRAECRYHAGQFAAASADYAAAEADATEFTTAELARFGDAALRAGDPAMAEKAFTSLSKREPEPVAQVELLRAISALHQGHADRARGILLQASARWPHDITLIDTLRMVSRIHYGNTPAVSTAAATDSTADAEPIVETSAVKATTTPESTGWRASKRRTATNPETPGTASSELQSAAPAELSQEVPSELPSEVQSAAPFPLQPAEAKKPSAVEATPADAFSTDLRNVEEPAPGNGEPATLEPAGGEPARLALPEGAPRLLP